MVSFNGNDPKYRSFFFGLHVTTLARMLMALTIIDDMYYYVSPPLSLFDLVKLTRTAIGTYGVFGETRTPLFIYLAICIVSSFILMITMMIDVADDAITDESANIILPLLSCVFCSLCTSIQFFTLKPFWNLVEYIKDRETAQHVIASNQKKRR